MGENSVAYLYGNMEKEVLVRKSFLFVEISNPN